MGHSRWKLELCGSNLNRNWSMVEQIETRGGNQIRACWNRTERIRNVEVNRTNTELIGAERLSETERKMNRGQIVVKTKKTNGVWMAADLSGKGN